MSAKHTHGRLKVQHPHAKERGWEIAFEPGLEQVCQDVTEDNARRLVACWNFFDGVPTEELEKGSASYVSWTRELQNQRDELLKALREIAEMHGQWNNGIYVARIARAAISKVRGDAT